MAPPHSSAAASTQNCRHLMYLSQLLTKLLGSSHVSGPGIITGPFSEMDVIGAATTWLQNTSTRQKYMDAWRSSACPLRRDYQGTIQPSIHQSIHPFTRPSIHHSPIHSSINPFIRHPPIYLPFHQSFIIPSIIHLSISITNDNIQTWKAVNDLWETFRIRLQ